MTRTRTGGFVRVSVLRESQSPRLRLKGSEVGGQGLGGEGGSAAGEQAPEGAPGWAPARGSRESP